MKSLDRRLTALEQHSGNGSLQVGVIIRTIVRPGANGPVETGEEYATILTGSRGNIELSRNSDESSEAFRMRVLDVRENT